MRRAISNNALSFRLAMSRGMVALIKSMPRGGLLFNYWPLVRPGRPGDVVHRNWRIIARKVVGRATGNDVPAISPGHTHRFEKPSCHQIDAKRWGDLNLAANLGASSCWVRLTPSFLSCRSAPGARRPNAGAQPRSGPGPSEWGAVSPGMDGARPGLQDRCG